jgi:sulfotransferase family protein
MIPTFFIVGAPRCGTTSLASYLDSHHRVYMSKPKEPHHFGRDIEIRLRPYASLHAYMQLFTGVDTQHVGDASVLYLYSRTAPDEILALNPDARIIIMLRDPLEMIPSLHCRNLMVNEDIPDLGKALEAETDRRQGRRIPSTCIAPLCLQYTSLAKYSDHVLHYQQAFGRERVMCIFTEDLKTEPVEVYNRALAFLGLEGGHCPDFKIHNPDPRQVWRHPRMGRTLLWACLRTGLRDSVPTTFLPSIVRRNRDLMLLLMKLNLRPAPPPQLTREVRQTLREQLQSDVERLGDALDRDLSAWLKPDP